MEGIIRTKRYTIDRAAYLRAMWAKGLGSRLAYLVVILVGATGALWALGQASLAIGALIGGSVVWPIAVLVRYLLARRSIYGAEVGQAFDDARTMEFSEAGYHTRTEGGVDATVPWSHIQRFETRGGFLLLSMSRNYVCVPDAAFETPDERAALLDLLARKAIGKKGSVTPSTPQTR